MGGDSDLRERLFRPIPPYTPETLAERWACSPQQIRRMVRRGELCAFRGGRWFESSIAHQ